MGHDRGGAADCYGDTDDPRRGKASSGMGVWRGAEGPRVERRMSSSAAPCRRTGPSAALCRRTGRSPAPTVNMVCGEDGPRQAWCRKRKKEGDRLGRSGEGEMGQKVDVSAQEGGLRLFLFPI